MARRYGICRVLEVNANEYAAEWSAFANVNTTSVIPSDSQTGTPLYGFAFCAIGFVQLSNVNTATNSFILPDYPLDAAMIGMESATRTALKQNVEAYNWDGNGYHIDATDVDEDSMAYQDVLIGLIQQIEPTFSAASFTAFYAQEP